MINFNETELLWNVVKRVGECSILLSWYFTILTDEDILRMLQQIFCLLIARIYGDELDLLKM